MTVITPHLSAFRLYLRYQSIPYCTVLSSFQQERRRLVRHMGDPRKWELTVGITYVPDRVRIAVRESHVAVDRRGFLRRQLHELLDQENGLGAVSAEVELLIDHIVRNFLPFPVDLLVPLVHPVQVHLAQVMEQGGNRHRLFRRRLGHQEQKFLRILIHVNGMLA